MNRADDAPVGPECSCGADLPPRIVPPASLDSSQLGESGDNNNRNVAEVEQAFSEVEESLSQISTSSFPAVPIASINVLV